MEFKPKLKNPNYFSRNLSSV